MRVQTDIRRIVGPNHGVPYQPSGPGIAVGSKHRQLMTWAVAPLRRLEHLGVHTHRNQCECKHRSGGLCTSMDGNQQEALAED